MMKFTRYVYLWKRILFPAACLFLSGCGDRLPQTPLPDTSSKNRIHDGGESEFQCDNEKLTFRSTGYYAMEFIDVFGEKRNEMTSGLWIDILGKSEMGRYFKAYSGLVIYYYDSVVSKIETVRR
jgi:hypothetical protein